MDAAPGDPIESETATPDRRRDLELLFRGLPDLMAAVRDGRFKILNPAWTRVLGWGLDELRGEFVTEFVHPDDVAATLAAMDGLVDDGESAMFGNRFLCQDGAYRWLQWTAMFQQDSIYVVARDVTDSKETEAALRESQQFLESVVDNIPNMVFVKDAAELRFVRINHAGLKLLGYSMDDLVGKNDFDFFPLDEATFFVDKDREVLAGADVLDIPFETIETRYQGKRVLHTKKIPIHGDDGEPAYLLGIAEDITAKIEGEELLAALAVAHEAQEQLTDALEAQRHIAETLQQSLLPSEVPTIPGVEVAARYWPSTEDLDVGGDFYDVFPLRDNRWGVLIGDVCGKGVAAAALTATARHSARAAATHVRDPSDVLRWVYDAVVAQVTDRFVTMAYGILELADGGGTLTLALGGHPHPMLVHADGTNEALGNFGTLIGIIGKPRFSTTVIELTRGDTVAFYTDGLTDAPGGRALSWNGLAELLVEHGAEPLEVVADEVHEAVLERSHGSLDDDTALLLLRIA